MLTGRSRFVVMDVDVVVIIVGIGGLVSLRSGSMLIITVWPVDIVLGYCAPSVDVLGFSCIVGFVLIAGVGEPAACVDVDDCCSSGVCCDDI